MSAAAQRSAVDARLDGQDPQFNEAWRSSSRWAAEVKSGNKVVPLFVEPSMPAARETSSGPSVVDWPAALDLIRDVGVRVRWARDFAEEVSRRSHTIIQRSVKQTEDAERRAEAAEAAAQAATVRADKSDERARHLEARANLAKKQADDARAGEAEAQRWLQRVLACLSDELSDLTVDLD